MPETRLFVRLSPAELATVRQRAEARGLTVTDLIRRLLRLPAAKRGRPRKEAK